MFVEPVFVALVEDIVPALLAFEPGQRGGPGGQEIREDDGNRLLVSSGKDGLSGETPERHCHRKNAPLKTGILSADGLVSAVHDPPRRPGDPLARYCVRTLV